MTANGDINYSPNSANYQSHLPPQRERVTVFWDYENCPCPMSTKIATLTYDIKRRIDRFLGKKLNKRIQLYCPMQRLHQRTRENATDLGILMMDVASKRKQESVDKRIIADIGLFAAELAESKGSDIGHIVLVSGDSDYGYILARLRDKSYIGKVILFINDYTKETLTQHADYTYCLFQSNLTRKENPFSEYNQRKIPHSQKITSYGMTYSPSTYVSHSHSRLNATYNNNQQFSLPQQYSNGHGATSTEWTTSTYNFPYQNGHNADPNDPYSNKSREGDKARNGAPRSASYHSLPATNGHSSGSKQRASRSRSPNGYSHKKSKDRDSSKSDSKKTTKASSNGSGYVYRRKEKDKDKATPSTKNKSKDHILNAPTPIPPKPSPLKTHKSNGSSKSPSARVVSQENLEEQLKQQQQKEKSKEDSHQKHNNNNNNHIFNGSSLTESNTPYTSSAGIDGNNNKNLSTFSVGSLGKISESDDEPKNRNKHSNLNGHKSNDGSPIKPAKLNFNFDGNSAGLSSDFFETLVAPQQDEMEKLMKDIVPDSNIFDVNNGTKLPPKTDHIVDFTKIRRLNSNISQSISSTAPKKLLCKKRSNNSNIKQSSSSVSPNIAVNNNYHHHHQQKHNQPSSSDQFREELGLVWAAVAWCQQNGNTNPRRTEIYKAMIKTHPELMANRDANFANKAIDHCLCYGAVEELIAGRISSLYLLPIISEALISSDSSFCTALKSRKPDNNGHIWVTLESLKKYLLSKHGNHASATYFTATYLNRMILNATRLYALHKDDKHKNFDNLNDDQLQSIRFRVRKSAWSHHQKFKAMHHQNIYNNNNNLTFNYYS